ncbi:hypothetical protein EYC80_006637 [Monilinia laxa]|uniref:Methyltransferase domain-containing protein n=1 Tax=Monilinia laxa TaxID=61186 RepID=A0A5N6JTA9_MONLA|nr:hypothetical protein EYC80_006637 [Monilinia laxa]
MQLESSEISPNPASPSTLAPETASAHDSALELLLSESHHDESSAPSNPESVDHDDEEEESSDDHDSAFGDSLIGCDIETLATYITDYRYENGRRYHAYQDGEYWGPKDESSSDSQDLAHHMPELIIGSVGTGTGIWAIEMAEAYPSANVIGTDLSPIQLLFVPPNCAFEIEDLNFEWTYPKTHFDFIHIWELFGCVVDWDVFFSETLSCLRPGGYVEILEHSVWPVSDDDTVNEKSFFTKWGKTVTGLGEKFVLKELGRWNQYGLYEGVGGFMIRLLTVVGGWSYEAAQVFLAEMRKALKDENIHAYLDVTVVYGRRPEA